MPLGHSTQHSISSSATIRTCSTVSGHYKMYVLYRMALRGIGW